MTKSRDVFRWVLFLVFVLFIYGCAGNRKALEEQVAYQTDTINELQKENTALKSRLSETEAQLQQSAQQPSPAVNVENLRSTLEAQLRGKGVGVKVRDGEVVLSLPATKLFEPGQFTLKPQARTLLTDVSRAIKTQAPTAMVRVEGHTDNQPIRKQKDRFKSNWELSAARASSVLHYLVEKCNMSPKKVYLAGFGEYQPVGNNKTSSGRQLNRRVEIVVIPQERT